MLLLGLVAITPGAGYVNIGQSIFIGTIASLVSNLAVNWKAKSTIDDTLDVFPCHGLGGMVGMFFTGVFASGVGLIYGTTNTFLIHIAALIGVSIFSFGGSFILFKITDLLIPLRVSEEQELIGLRFKPAWRR